MKNTIDRFGILAVAAGLLTGTARGQEAGRMVHGVNLYGRTLATVRLPVAGGPALALDSLLVVRGWAWAWDPSGWRTAPRNRPRRWPAGAGFGNAAPEARCGRASGARLRKPSEYGRILQRKSVLYTLTTKLL